MREVDNMITNMFNEEVKPKCAYRADVHNFIKAMDKAGIVFPTTKAEMMKKFGDMQIQIDYDNKCIPAKAFIEKMVKEDFDCASSFYDAMFAELIPNSIQYE